jgi:hypothetical protein
MAPASVAAAAARPHHSHQTESARAPVPVADAPPMVTQAVAPAPARQRESALDNQKWFWMWVARLEAPAVRRSRSEWPLLEPRHRSTDTAWSESPFSQYPPEDQPGQYRDFQEKVNCHSPYPGEADEDPFGVIY